MKFTRVCAWCGYEQEADHVICERCGHRLDVPKDECTCEKCKHKSADEVQHYFKLVQEIAHNLKCTCGNDVWDEFLYAGGGPTPEAATHNILGAICKHCRAVWEQHDGKWELAVPGDTSVRFKKPLVN